MYCRNCSNEVIAEAIACPKCGVPPLKGKNFCYNCCHETHIDAIICTQCGVSLKTKMDFNEKKMLSHWGRYSYINYIVILLLSLMSFANITCGEAKIISITGLNLAVGKENKYSEKEASFNDSKKTPKTIFSGEICIFYLLIVACGIILLTNKDDRFEDARNLTIIAFLLLLEWFIYASYKISKSDFDGLNVSFGSGFWLTAIVTISTIVLLSALIKENKVYVSNAANVKRSIQEFFISFYVWAKKNVDFIYYSFIVVIILFAYYRIVIYDDPASNGESVAKKECSCYEDGMKILLEKSTKFYSDFENQHFKTKEIARNGISLITKQYDAKRDGCKEYYTDSYNNFLEKYKEDNEKKEQFIKGYNEKYNNYEFSNFNKVKTILSDIETKINSLVETSDKQSTANQNAVENSSIFTSKTVINPKKVIRDVSNGNIEVYKYIITKNIDSIKYELKSMGAEFESNNFAYMLSDGTDRCYSIEIKDLGNSTFLITYGWECD